MGFNSAFKGLNKPQTDHKGVVLQLGVGGWVKKIQITGYWSNSSRTDYSRA